MLVSVYVTLGMAHQLSTWLVILVVFRDVLIVGGFLLIQAVAVPKRYDPLYISKINTGMQITLVGFVLARLGLGADAGWLEFCLEPGSGRDDIGVGASLSRTMDAHPRALRANFVSAWCPRAARLIPLFSSDDPAPARPALPPILRPIGFPVLG